MEEAIKDYEEAQKTLVMEDMMDLFKSAVDKFNQTRKKAAGVDIELEAIAQAWLGKIFFRGLKNNEKARTHLEECMQLKFSLLPKVPADQALLTAAESDLIKVREYFRKKEEDDEAKATEADKAKIKPQMDVIEEMVKKGEREFL